MGILDQVQQMQAQGYSDQEVIRSLQDQGYKAKEIQDAVSQSKVKAAIDSEESVQNSVMQNQEMQPSLMSSNQNQQLMNQEQAYGAYPQQGYNQQGYPQEQSPDQGYPQEQYPVNQGYPQEQYPPTPAPSEQYDQQAYPQENQGYGGYEQYQGYTGGGGYSDTETINEIAEQVVAEKISEIKKAIGNIADFKAMSEARTKDIDKRVKRIEEIIDKLQSSIVDKIGTFGKSVEALRTELDATQESFTKVINPLVDRARADYARKTTSKKKK
ncbi:MAG: hypothetical protein ABIH72_04390 [archaeon]